MVGWVHRAAIRAILQPVITLIEPKKQDLSITQWVVLPKWIGDKDLLVVQIPLIKEEEYQPNSANKKTFSNILKELLGSFYVLMPAKSKLSATVSDS